MTNGNDPTSPQVKMDVSETGDTSVISTGGLTKREHFAAMAMQGFISNNEALKAFAAIHVQIKDWPLAKVASMMAVENADALIEALNK